MSSVRDQDPASHLPVLTRRRAVAGMAAAGPVLWLPSRARAAAPVATLTVLHTNDTHSRMEPFASGRYQGQAGVARRATLVRGVRQEQPNTLLVDAGDTFQGTPWFNQFQGSIDLQVMNALGYDATCIGNHDFDAGTERLRENLNFAPQMSALAANFAIEPGSILADRIQPSVILEKGVKVGLFGLGVAFEGLVNPKLHKGVSYTDPREAARAQVAHLREQGCQVVVALSHLGHDGYKGEVGDTEWPKDVPGVDYVVGGHTHTFLDEPLVVPHASGWRTTVLQVGHSGLLLGRADIRVDARGRAEVTAAAGLPVRPFA